MTTLTQSRPFEQGSQGGSLTTLRRLANSWATYRAASSARRASAEADRQMWNAALADPRIMAEIERARVQQAG